jgi:hypothetical protein
MKGGEGHCYGATASWRSAIFARTPNAHDKDRIANNLITQLVDTNDDAPNLARSILIKAIADARMLQ